MVDRHTRNRWIAAGAAAGLALVLAGVVPGAGAASGASSTITYTKKTVLIPTSTIKNELLSVSTDGAVYTFKAKKSPLTKLKVGSVMLLQDEAVRDVTKLATSKGHFVVSTKPAEITDLIANGTLSWNTPIDFSKGFGVGGSAVPSRVGAATVPERLGMQPLTARSGITLKGKANTYSYSVGFQKDGKAVAVTIKISKASPVEVEGSITGTLGNLTTAGDISINHGKLASTKMVTNGLNGDFTLAYSAKPISQFGLGSAGGVKVTLPAELVVPFTVGPVPLFLGIKVAIFASAGFSSFSQSLSGSYTISYDGAGGFSTSSSGATSTSGVLKGLGDIVLKAANAVKTGPITFIFGAQMPEIDLGLGVKGLNVAGNITLVGSSGIATYGAGCDTRQFEVTGSAGAEANFFGFSAGLGSTTLFDKTVQAAYPKGCGVFPSGDAQGSQSSWRPALTTGQR